ncbi:MAG TPA: long-chain fatty acid--CoA ligase [Candidatus Acidoferrales bacterium]|nr:long-chain fatty acid--CoA ligase [Candidatus Acidoferrales bacterium]
MRATHAYVTVACMAAGADAGAKYPPLTKCFLDAVDKFANPRAQMYRVPGEGGAGAWHAIAAHEMLRRVAGLSKSLLALGTQQGDRVALFAPNCPEWHIADFAIQGAGGIVVPIYFNESPDRAAYILNDSGARIVFTFGEAQAHKMDELRSRAASVEHVISVAPPRDLRGPVYDYDSLIASAGDTEIAEYRERAVKITPDQLATIIYTSGTTGEPKGVMLTHSNLGSNAIDSFSAQEFFPDDIALSLLPLAHVYERVNDYGLLFHGVALAYVEHLDAVAQALLEVRPTIAAAVPRFYEKIYAGIIEKGHRETGWKRKVFDWALRVARKSVPWRAHGGHVSTGLYVQWLIANAMVYKRVREGIGGRIRFFISGGAPISAELVEFFWSIGIPIYQGYGLTETSPVVAVNTMKANKVGTVGRPIPHVDVKIAADGEILVKGLCVMAGYYRKPDATREVLTPDGWFSTGDIGKLDDDGYLVITDRKKELLKTAGGKFIAPAPIENTLKTSPYILNAIVVGDRRKFAAVLIVPNAEAVAAAAQKAGRANFSRDQITSDPWVRGLIENEVERLMASFAQYEKPKRFALIDKDFTYAAGELTYTLKLKRRVIEEEYKGVIAGLYADVEEPRPLPQA